MILLVVSLALISFVQVDSQIAVDSDHQKAAIHMILCQRFSDLSVCQSQEAVVKKSSNNNDTGATIGDSKSGAKKLAPAASPWPTPPDVDLQLLSTPAAPISKAKLINANNIQPIIHNPAATGTLRPDVAARLQNGGNYYPYDISSKFAQPYSNSDLWSRIRNYRVGADGQVVNVQQPNPYNVLYATPSPFNPWAPVTSQAAQGKNMQPVGINSGFNAPYFGSSSNTDISPMGSISTGQRYNAAGIDVMASNTGVDFGNIPGLRDLTGRGDPSLGK